jgi:hypothetical protein
MLTYKHTHNGGGYAAAESHYAPRRVRRPHLRPQGSLTRSLRDGLRPPLTSEPRRPPTGAQRGQAQRLPDPRAAQTTQANYKITPTEVSTDSGDCHS